jgi:hypothetical protein
LAFIFERILLLQVNEKINCPTLFDALLMAVVPASVPVFELTERETDVGAKIGEKAIPLKILLAEAVANVVAVEDAPVSVIFIILFKDASAVVA